MTQKTAAAIAADSPLTVAAGVQIAELGGNAVDIAVAAALAATLSEILMCSLGGSAFLMIQMPGKAVELIDGADAMPSGHLQTNPAAAGAREVHLPYGDGITVRGGHATVAVPGMLAALETAWQRHGSLPWRELVNPALELARNGYPLSPMTERWLSIAGELLFYPQLASRECFFPNGSDIARGGEWFKVPCMEQTLDAIATEGAKAFYQGDLAAVFAEEMAANGGFVTREDLANYRAQIRQPLKLHSAGFELDLNPPPAVGGAALGSLIRLLEQNWNSDATPAERALQQAQAQQVLLQLRQGSFKNLDPAQIQALLKQEYLREHLTALHSPHTTHLSVATREGELVALTMSSGYGSGITIPGTGIACNNTLGEPELNPLGFLTAPVGSRLVSNMAPTIARHPDGRCLAFGTPGASRITTSMAQVWVNYAFDGLPLSEAVTAPRLHLEQAEAELRFLYEPGIIHNLIPKEFVPYPFGEMDMFFGAIKIAGLNSQGQLQAQADSRRQGASEIV
ncbi:MAG: gamma-glutamyltransferase [Microcoleaceae cyanobacterium]